MNRNGASANGWLWLTLPIAVLLSLGAGLGLFTVGLYRDPPGLVAQAIGQDVITLFVALPALVISAILASRGSQRARLVWLGVLVYVVYTYASYSFGIRFNPLFLLYVALLGCATYALVGGLLTTDRVGVKAAFGERTPVKAVSIFLLVIAAVFYLMWLSEVVPASLTGTVPQSVRDDGTPTNVIHVLDMGLLLPAIVLAAISLWRKQPMGYVVAPALLANLVFLPLAILSMVFFQARGGEAVPTPLLVIFGGLFVASLGILIWDLNGLRPPRLSS